MATSSNSMVRDVASLVATLGGPPTTPCMFSRCRLASDGDYPVQTVALFRIGKMVVSECGHAVSGTPLRHARASSLRRRAARFRCPSHSEGAAADAGAGAAAVSAGRCGRQLAGLCLTRQCGGVAGTDRLELGPLLPGHLVQAVVPR